VPQAVSVLWNCLAYFNSCVNPIIYNRTSKEFRDAFLEVCGCRRPNGGRSESADPVIGGDARRVSLVARMSHDGLRHTASAYSPSHSPSPDAGIHRSATTSEHLSPASTALHAAEHRKSSVLTVPTMKQPQLV